MHEYSLYPEAKQILRIAYERDSTDEAILALLIETEMELGAYYAISGHLKDLFALRRPPYETIADFRSRMLSDRFLFTEDREFLLRELDEILAEQDSMDWNIWDFQNADSG